MPSVVRGIATLGLDGKTAIELESDYTLSILLRELDDDDLDDGAVNLRPYDPANQDVTISPNGGGYSCSFRASPGAATALFAGTITQNGVRSTLKLTFTGVAVDGDTVTITYPNLADPDVIAPIITRTYRFQTTTSQAYDIKVSGVGATDAANLIRAINGTFDYGDPAIYFGTIKAKEVVAVADPNAVLALQLEARDGGVWGNNIIVAETLTNGAWAGGGTLLTGGTGLRGITLAIDHALLPNSLVASGVSNAVTYDIMGLDSAATADPTKLVAGAANLYASNTVTT